MAALSPAALACRPHALPVLGNAGCVLGPSFCRSAGLVRVSRGGGGNTAHTSQWSLWASRIVRPGLTHSHQVHIHNVGSDRVTRRKESPGRRRPALQPQAGSQCVKLKTEWLGLREGEKAACHHPLPNAVIVSDNRRQDQSIHAIQQAPEKTCQMLQSAKLFHFSPSA